MALWDSVRQFLSLGVEGRAVNPALTPAQMTFQTRTERINEVKLQTRSIDPFAVPDFETQLATIMRVRTTPYRIPSIQEALGVPAIQRAVALIANTTGSLEMQEFVNGAVSDPSRLVSRPDPYLTPRDFKRDSAYYLATRGEAVWWIGARDADSKPASLIVVPLAELSIEANPRNRLFPVYTWGDIKSTRYSGANTDGQFVHVTYLKEPGQLRGMGPLQMCGAAVSVSVEAQDWAANFYAEGGRGGTLIKAVGEGDELEAAALKAQWMETPNNVPHVVFDGIEEVKEVDVNPNGAQMLDSRYAQNGEAALMFGIPGSLMNYGTPGASLTYQNVAEEFTKFLKTCLAPNYLEPIEQAMTDLLPRSHTARFFVDGLLRADIKTRFDVYASGITSGVLSVEKAQEMEGIIPGSIEVAPVPFAAPIATPSSLPQLRSVPEVRCNGTRMLRGLVKPCNKLLAEAAPFVGTCPRCGKGYMAA